jgi:hypothetical protein
MRNWLKEFFTTPCPWAWEEEVLEEKTMTIYDLFEYYSLEMVETVENVLLTSRFNGEMNNAEIADDIVDRLHDFSRALKHWKSDDC